MRNTYGELTRDERVSWNVFLSLSLSLQERFDDDDDNNSAFNKDSALAAHNAMPIDEMIAVTRVKLDFETSVFKLMMSKRFRGRTRFRMATRFVMIQVGWRGRAAFPLHTTLVDVDLDASTAGSRCQSSEPTE